MTPRELARAMLVAGVFGYYVGRGAVTVARILVADTIFGVPDAPTDGPSRARTMADAVAACDGTTCRHCGIYDPTGQFVTVDHLAICPHLTNVWPVEPDEAAVGIRCADCNHMFTITDVYTALTVNGAKVADLLCLGCAALQAIAS